MKKLFFLVITLAFTNVIFAQTEQGKFILSGATGLQFISSNVDYEYDGQSQGDFTQSSFSIMPSIGYFVMDNLAVGLSANFSSFITSNAAIATLAATGFPPNVDPCCPGLITFIIALSAKTAETG